MFLIRNFWSILRTAMAILIFFLIALAADAGASELLKVSVQEQEAVIARDSGELVIVKVGEKLKPDLVVQGMTEDCVYLRNTADGSVRALRIQDGDSRNK